MTATQALLDEAVGRHQAGDLAGAETLYLRVLEADPENPVARMNRAAILLDRGDAAGAAAACRDVLRTGAHGAAHCILGIALFNLDRPAEALAAFDAALLQAPDMAEAHNGRANVLRRLGRTDEAIIGYTQAIACNPAFADAYNNRAVAWQYLRRIPEALADYDAALTRMPSHADARWNRALVKLLEGDYLRGWADYEWRWRSAVMRRHARDFREPRWRGEDIAGKTILIHAEQGLGDVLQFCRYVPLVAARGARVVLEAHRPLRRLLATLEGVDTIVTSDEPKPPFDVHCPMLSLPSAFGTTVDTIPAAVPYLAPDPALVAVWRAKIGPRRGPRVGVVWAGRPDNQNDTNRSMPVEMLAPWLSTGVELHCLQKEVSPADRAWAEPRGVIFHDRGLIDFAETAALAAEMDAVVSVCTSVAHLAGALGLPVWIALCFAADWRWLMNRGDSPWYPTARLFRQPAPGDWSAVVDSIAAELRGLK